jgi:hypothetical protein
MEIELKKNLESLLHEKERQLEAEIKSRKEASNSSQQVNEKINNMEKIVSFNRSTKKPFTWKKGSTKKVINSLEKKNWKLMLAKCFIRFEEIGKSYKKTGY